MKMKPKCLLCRPPKSKDKTGCRVRTSKNSQMLDQKSTGGRNQKEDLHTVLKASSNFTYKSNVSISQIFVPKSDNNHMTKT